MAARAAAVGKRLRWAFSLGWLLGLAVAAGALLGAVALLPTLSAMPNTTRALGTDYKFASSYAWPSLRYLTLFDRAGLARPRRGRGAGLVSPWNHWELAGYYQGLIAALWPCRGFCRGGAVGRGTRTGLAGGWSERPRPATAWTLGTVAPTRRRARGAAGLPAVRYRAGPWRWRPAASVLVSLHAALCRAALPVAWTDPVCHRCPDSCRACRRVSVRAARSPGGVAKVAMARPWPTLGIGLALALIGLGIYLAGRAEGLVATATPPLKWALHARAQIALVLAGLLSLLSLRFLAGLRGAVVLLPLCALSAADQS